MQQGTQTCTQTLLGQGKYVTTEGRHMMEGKTKKRILNSGEKYAKDRLNRALQKRSDENNDL